MACTPPAWTSRTAPNGTVLRLPLVAWRRQHWVAVVVPVRLPITSVVAYSRRGELAHTVPFRDEVITWLAPGQAGRPRVTIPMGSGKISGRSWSATAYVGPWGLCLEADSIGDCIPGAASLVGTGKLVHMMICGPLQNGPAAIIISAAAQVVRLLRLQLSDGSTVTAHPVSVGPSWVFALATRPGAQLTGWTAYGAAGQRLGSGAGFGANCGS